MFFPDVQPEQVYVKWDPDPVIALGNAWISFGNTLNLNLSTMSVVELDLTAGGWLGTASVAMDGAWDALRQPAQKLVNSCWDMGETINYYALLRSQQEQTEAKEWLKEELLEIFGVLALLLLPLGGIIGAALDAIVDLVDVAGLVTEAADAVSTFAADAASFILDSVGVDADALTIPSWVSTMGEVASGVADASINYTIYNAVTEAAADGIARLPVGPNDLSPIPTGAGGWAALIGMISLGGLGPLFKDGADADGAGKGTSDPDVNTDTVSGSGVDIPKVNPDGTTIPKPEVGSSSGAGKVTEGPGDSITDHGATVNDGADIVHQAPGFGGSVDARTDSSVSESVVSVKGPSGGGARDVSQVKSDPVNLDGSPNADVGFKNDITDTSSSPATGSGGSAIRADLSHDGPVTGDPETTTATGGPVRTDDGSVTPGQAPVKQDDAGGGGDLTMRSPDNGDQGGTDLRTPSAGPPPSDQGTPVAHEPSPVSSHSAGGGDGQGSDAGRDSEPVISSPQTTGAASGGDASGGGPGSFAGSGAAARRRA